MPVHTVSVKWGKEKYSVDANTDELPEIFKAQMFALTGVAPERQKIMFKGKTLSDDWSTFAALKNGVQLMMMGSADAVPQAPAKKTVFVEDLSDAQMAQALEIPPGLKNLGNTCYMNATLQCLKTVPELRDSLLKFEGEIGAAMAGVPNASEAMTAAVRDLYATMDRTGARQESEVIPLIMLQVLHLCFPHFAEKDEHGHFKQQDANEFWTELMRMFQQKLGQGAANTINQYFGGKLEIELKCKENEEEPVTEQKEDFLTLSCFIQATDVKYLHSGIRARMSEEITKHSTALDRDAKYQKESRLSRLPAYLTVQMVRFEYKERSQVNAKILKDVKFPMSLDVFDLCSPELQQKLMPMRDRLKTESDRLMELQKRIKAGDATEPDKKKNIKVPFSFEDDAGSNNSGFYELQAVLTHKGRSSNVGHYVAWVRAEEDKWIMCDDDVVQPILSEDVLKLSGGGDWHCAYVLLYGPKVLELDPENIENGENSK